MKGRRWTEYEVSFLIKHYATRTCADIAEWVHHSPRSVQSKAFTLGLHKSKEFKAERRKVGQFTKGHRPFTKGKQWADFMSEEGRRNSAKTQFKPGEVNPHSPTLRPVGYECVRTEKGRKYIWIKPEGRRMMPKHRYIWEQANGPIPKGWCVMFKDKDTTNCDLDNLYIISRGALLRKNYDALPEERKAACRAKIQESRNAKIRADKVRLKWGLEPLTRLVKRVE